MAEEVAAAGVYADLGELARLEYKASGFSFLPRQPVQSLLTGRHASRLRGRGLNFEEIRRYLPGDDIRTIDWRITQRTGKPHVRVFTEERDRPAILCVDQRLSMFFGSRRAMKSVVAAELAALSAWRVFASGDRVGALVFNDAGIEEIGPHRSRRRVMRILDTVTRMNRELRVDAGIEANPGMLNQVLEKAARLAVHDHLVCLISDFSGFDDHSQRLLTRIAAHNDVIAALLYDPIKLDMPEAGRLVVSDGELQLELDSGRGRMRKRVSDFFDEQLQSIKDGLGRVGVPVLLIHTAEDPAVQIRRLLGYAPGRRG